MKKLKETEDIIYLMFRKIINLKIRGLFYNSELDDNMKVFIVI